MRRMAAFFLTLMLLFVMASGALAVSYSDRGRYYLYVTAADTQIYSMSSETAEDGTVTNTYTPSGTLPAGTPVSTLEVMDEIYQKVVYMDQSSSTHTVIIRKDVIKGNYVTLDFGGSAGSVRIPRPAAANAAFIRDYLNYRGISVTESQIQAAMGLLPDEAQSDQQEDVGEENDSFPTATLDPDATPDPDAKAQPTSAKKNASKSSSSAKSKSTPAPSQRETVSADLTLYLDNDGNLISVTQKELGTARSIVVAGKQELTVETDDLLWGTNAGDEERLAVVYAPKSGKATLRKTSKKSSAVLAKVPAGTVLRVFDIGKTMTGVYYGNTAGYMLNTTLNLCGSTSDYTTGKLSYNGSLTNTHRINLYSGAKESSRKIEGVNAGMNVTILSSTGTWTEVDIDGYHGYILSKFITPDEEKEPTTDLSSLDFDAPVSDEDEYNALEGAGKGKASDAPDEETEEVESITPVSTPRVNLKEQKDSNGYSMGRDPYN